MTAPTLERPQSTFYVSSGFGIRPSAMFRKKDNTLRVERQPVFRSGTFRDSAGFQNTWEPIHIDQMVSNFNYLREQRRLVDIPARHGHPGWLINNTPGTGAVVGWHTSLVAEEMDSPFGDGKFTYILADYEILDPEAARNVEAGLWRNRSAEVIHYTTNDEAEFWPVYAGFAFVDIPAVEGLNFSRNDNNASNGARFFVMLDKEIPVTQPAGAPAPANQTGAQPVLPFSVDSRFTAPTTQTGQVAPQAGANAVFSINGQPTSDFAAVQNHINTLEGFRRETIESARTDFVDTLLGANVFLASAKDDLVAYAKSLSDEQFAAWRGMYAHVQANPILAQHGAPAAGTQGTPQSGALQGQPTPAQEEIETAKGIVAMHRNAGTPEAKLKDMPSYKKLVAAGIEQA